MRPKERENQIAVKRALAKKYHNLKTLAGSAYKKQKFTTKASKYEHEAKMLEKGPVNP